MRRGWAMAESLTISGVVKENKVWKGVFAVSGIMTTLVIYGVLQVMHSVISLGRVDLRC